MNAKGHGFSDNFSKKNNKDAFLINDKLGLYIVCDGSSAGKGDLAASMTCKNIEQYIFNKKELIENYNNKNSNENKNKLKQLIEEAIHFANNQLYETILKNADWANTVSTVAVALIIKDQLITAHAGNSRIYHVKDSQINSITQDHTAHEFLLKDGKNENEINKNLKKSLTNAIGLRYVQVKAECRILFPNESYILCTDGFYDDFGLNNSKGIENYKKITTDVLTEEIPKKLVDHSITQGTKDDSTLIIVKINLFDDHAKDLDQQLKAIKKIRAFSDISHDDSQLRKIHSLFIYGKIPPSQPIVIQGEESNSLYVILKGRVNIFVNGKIVEDPVVFEGNLVGEMGFFTGWPRTATVITLENTEVIKLDKKDFLELIEKDHDLEIKILKGIIKELTNKIIKNNETYSKVTKI